MIPPLLLKIALQFFVLSLLSIGGANAVIPEIQRRVVETEHSMTDVDFAQLFALSQAAPGPNVLIVSLVGWKIAGVVGGVVAMFAMCAPSSVLTYAVAHAWERWRDASWRIAAQVGLAPVTVGLSSRRATYWRVQHHAWAAYAITGATLLLTLTTRLHPLWMLGVAAGLGTLGIV